jgi:subtilisin family serine protease
MAVAGLAAVSLLVGSSLVSGAPAPATPVTNAVAGAGQWGLTMVGATSAWTRAAGRGQTIAVIDSGVNPVHPDLAGSVVGEVACLNTGGTASRCQGSGIDTDGHGTSVAAIAAGRGVPGGVAGIAPAASILAVKVLNNLCLPQLVGGILCRLTTNSNDVNAAIHWSVDHGASVVNLSIEGVTLLGLPIGPAVQYAWQHGVIVVAATGNNANLLMGPGYDGLPLMSVTAVNRGGGLASYANNIGPVRWGMAAPGGELIGSCPSTQVLSTRVTGYGCWWGTSFAAPHVAGALALLRSMGLTAEQAVNQLIGSARPLSTHPPDQVYGYGLLQIGVAATNVVGRITPPIPTTVAPAGSAPPVTPGGSHQPAPAAPAAGRSGVGGAGTSHTTATGPSPLPAPGALPAVSSAPAGLSLGHALTRSSSHGGLEPWAGVAIGLVVAAAGGTVYERRRGVLGGASGASR